jgi:two-component system nitrogen regulation sensor histidine kinase GlnL
MDGSATAPDYQDIFEGQSTAIVVLGKDLVVRAMNPAAENLLGFSSSRAAGQAFLSLVENDGTLAAVLDQALVNNVTFAYETRLMAKDELQEDRRIECRIAPLDRLSDEPAVIMEIIDITRRARINRENALMVQHGAGRQMVRQLAHEIKNPLGGLRGAAQLLGKQLSSDELREYTDVIISEADRLAALVDTLLGPGGPPSKSSVNIHEVVEYVLRLLEPEFAHGVQLRRDYDPGLPNLHLDRDQIVQALLNLIRNALTALDGKGNIVVRTRADLNFTIGDCRHPVVATIEIEDDGPGIPRSLQDSVFYPLVTSRPDGTGLGLPAAQELLSRHGGLIEFDSRPGRTIFYVRIPLTEESA